MALVLGGTDLLDILEAPAEPGGSAAAARLAGWFAALTHDHRRTPAAPPTVQALHRRELQILKLVEQGLRNREIGARLHISEETVKWYLKRVYESLGVNNRAHALARVRELKLLA